MCNRSGLRVYFGARARRHPQLPNRLTDASLPAGRRTSPALGAGTAGGRRPQLRSAARAGHHGGAAALAPKGGRTPATSLRPRLRAAPGPAEPAPKRRFRREPQSPALPEAASRRSPRAGPAAVRGNGDGGGVLPVAAWAAARAGGCVGRGGGARTGGLAAGGRAVRTRRRGRAGRG